MRFSRTAKFSISVFMGLFMSDLPALAVANHAMTSARTLVAEMERDQMEHNLRDFLSRNDVKKALQDRGVSAEEASSRLASLSAAELKQLNSQVQRAQAGGDILVTILLIVLIIFLIKRI